MLLMFFGQEIGHNFVSLTQAPLAKNMDNFIPQINHWLTQLVSLTLINFNLGQNL